MGKAVSQLIIDVDFLEVCFKWFSVKKMHLAAYIATLHKRNKIHPKDFNSLFWPSDSHACFRCRPNLMNVNIRLDHL